MKKFDREKSFDELYKTLSDLKLDGSFSTQLKEFEKIKDILEKNYNKGFDDGKKSKIETLKKLN